MANKAASFPFPFWGHACSTSDMVTVLVWFAREPNAAERRAINQELVAGLSFWKPTTAGAEGTWSGPVLEHSDILDRERKHVQLDHPLVAPVLARLDRALYDVAPETLTDRHQVGLSFHAGIEQRLRDLHARHPIALVVREAAPRDRFTAWHEHSLDRLRDALPCFERALALPVAIDKPDFLWLAPWVNALVRVARHQLAKAGIARLDGADKTALATIMLQAAERCRVDPEWPENSAVASDVAESAQALRAFAGKIAAPGKAKAAPVKNANGTAGDGAATLAQIQREAAQFEFTRIKLGECPSYVALGKGSNELQCDTIIAACTETIRHLERLYGKPGSNVMCFGAADQQALQVRERLMGQLLRKKLVFSVADGVRVLQALASSQNSIGAWLPLERLADKLRESLHPERANRDVQAALATLMKSRYALGDRQSPSEHRERFAALLAP